MKCKKCGKDLFKIQIIPCCDDCYENAAWYEDDDEYTYDEKVIAEKDLTRNRVYREGECSFGSAHGAGCFMFPCPACGKRENQPVMEC